jgi:hypothetical protein
VLLSEIHCIRERLRSAHLNLIFSKESKPVVFTANIEFNVDPNNAMGEILNITLYPQACSDRNQSLTPIIELNEPSLISFVDNEFVFDINFGDQIIPGEANCISGSLMQLDIVLRALLIDEDTFCGQIEGRLIRPFEYLLAGSTFGAIRINDYDDLENLSLLTRCE